MMKYLVLGNGAAGVTAAARLRELDRGSSITVISGEDTLAYSKIMLPDYIGGKMDKSRILIREKRFYEEKEIALALGHRVENIDVSRREVTLADRSVYGYDRLLIALGGTPFVPPIEGLNHVDYFLINSLKDADAIMMTAGSARKALIAGGGLTGIEMAFALSKRGVSVSLVEREKNLLPSILDDEASAVMSDALGKVGVSVYTGTSLERIMPGEASGYKEKGGRRASGEALLSDGSMLRFDMLLITIGTRPNTEVVKNTPILCRRGILVDQYMQTSEEGIYAAGDVAEMTDSMPGGYVSVYIWPNAMAQGKCAAANMAGQREAFSNSSFALSMVQLRDMPFQSMGQVNPRMNNGEVLTFCDRSSGLYKRIILQNNQVKGMVLIGDTGTARAISGLIRNGTDVSGYKEQLLSKDFSL